jgi:hypothetical protein
MSKNEPEYYDVGAVEMMLDGAIIPNAGRAEHAAVVQALTARGMDVQEIAVRAGVRERQVYRLRALRVEPMPDDETYDLTDERAEALEKTALIAMQLACEVRDDSEQAWDALVHMDAQQLRELSMTLACMVPVEFTVRDLLGWVDADEPKLQAVG